MRYWEVLHDLIDSEPAYDGYRNEYGNLAALGIAKGRPFAPGDRMTGILMQAAEIASAQMRVQSLADRRPDRIVWDGKQWEWAVLRPENGTFDTDAYVDLEAREKWFYQAQIESPAMFARAPGAGSLYWFSAHDSTGAYLDGGRSYRLTVPLPVPNKLFWSITVYDAETRTEIVTDQHQAALRSLIELTPEVLGDAGCRTPLRAGATTEHGRPVIKTIPGEDGSSTSASTDQTPQPSMARGSCGLRTNRLTVRAKLRRDQMRWPATWSERWLGRRSAPSC